MTEIKVDKGIEYQPHQKSGGKYPWATMEIGDSFLFPPDIKQTSIYNIAHTASRDGKKFMARTTPEGYRCWRIA